jgi:predicted DNA-binding transcriptional regulator YafY
VRADRLLSLVLLLQSRGHATAGQLARELTVSVRTIYRDMVALNTAGIPVLADATGYRLVDGYRTHLTGFTADEARALALAGVPAAAAELGLAKAVAAAQLKIATALPAALRDGADRMRRRFLVDTPGWYRDGDASEHLTAVADAVWRQRAIEVDYEAWTRDVQRRLEPYGLVLKAGKWYLVAGVAGTVRTYRVSQIRALTVLADQFDRPDGFDLETYWRGEVAGFRARLHTGEALVRLSPDTVPRLAHLMGAAVARAAGAGTTQPDGWVLARVPIESHAHAAGEFLRLGAGVEVLEPAPLRRLVAGIVADLAALYRAAEAAGAHP